MNKKKYAEIVIDNTSLHTDKLYTYIIPEKLIKQAKVGIRVFIPFGFSNKPVEGLIISIKENSNLELNKLKQITCVIDEQPILSQSLIKLGLWMKEKYLSQYIEVFRTIIPSGLSNKIKKYIKLNYEYKNHMINNITSSNQKEIIKFLLEHGEVELSKLKNVLEINNIYSSIKSLEKKQIIQIIQRIDKGINRKYEKFVYRSKSSAVLQNVTISLDKRAYKQKEILEFLINIDKIRLKDLMISTNSSLSSIKSLQKKGYIKIKDEEIKRNPISKKITQNNKLKLNGEQNKCFNTIIKCINNNESYKFLIHGITGSGKTEIYLQLIEKMLNLKKQSIVLVPEISLTPQTIERFAGRFGNKVAVLHSRLSLGERYDEWRKIKEGKVDIVVGARSAIFAPFTNLGLIIIDEEHENSYKSNMNPKYTTYEVAEMRCKIEGANLVLGSATPSVETYYKATNEDLKLLQLTKRVNNRNMPQVKIVDMKEELKNGNKSILSKQLYMEIKENLIKKKQTILFINRRGFSTFVSCRRCGYVVKCKKCDISLTYHRNSNILRCHYCGMAMKVPNVCPECGSKYIKYFGTGTQKVEEIVKKLFPEANIARMDLDTTSKKGSHEEILNKVKHGQIDILIGTQMITKGLDFPNVTLVGILAADLTLNLPDFRASERTFQLITQVSGRAGRGDFKGKVILQTYEPYHYSIQYAKNHDYKGFYNSEIMLRQEFEYPPFSNIISILLSSESEKKLVKVSTIVFKDILFNIKKDISNFDDNKLLGPNQAPIKKIKGNYRWQILIKCSNDEVSLIKKIINCICIKYKTDKKYYDIKISIDVNPNSIM